MDPVILLDSLRVLGFPYTSPIFTVRRETSADEVDIYDFNLSGNYNTSAGGAYTGDLSSENHFVKYWYDQSGYGNDFYRTTTSQQPKLILESSKPYVNFNGSQWLAAAHDSSMNFGTGDFSTFLRIKYTGSSAYAFLLYKYYFAGSVGLREYFNMSDDYYTHLLNNNPVKDGALSLNTLLNKTSIYDRDDLLSMYEDGSLVYYEDISSESASIDTTTPFLLGSNGGTGSDYIGNIRSVVLYNYKITENQRINLNLYYD